MEEEAWCMEVFDRRLRPPGVMRKGHRSRLAKEGDKESSRGRARYAQSVGKSRHLKSLAFHQPRKAKTSRFEPEGVLMTEGREALDWEATECASLVQWHDEDLTCVVEDLEATSSCEVVSSCGESFASWSLISTACALSDDEDAITPSSEAPIVASKPRCSRWAQGQATAAQVAKEYLAKLKEIKQREKRARRIYQARTTLVRKPAAEMDSSLSYAPRLASPPLHGGRPSFPDEHDAALACAANRPKYSGPKLQTVARSSSEFEAVTKYFKSTLGANSCEVEQLERIDNNKVQCRLFRGSSEHTLMFHGCRTPANETKILQDGFQVQSCQSGGMNYGTWFAYNAKYSNLGYAFTDREGFKHMFICVVSYYYTVMDNLEMRVVGQGCAYPQWLIKYKSEPYPSYSAAFRRKQVGSPAVWHVVRDGKWVQEAVVK